MNMFFVEDCQRILASHAQSAARYSGDFQEGYMAALADLAIAFGVITPQAKMRPQVTIWELPAPGRDFGRRDR